MLAALLLSLSLLAATSEPHQDSTVMEDGRVDVLEFNRVYSDSGGYFDQLIWWSWNTEHDHFEVADWRTNQSILLIPQRGGDWLCVFFDNRTGIFRRVKISHIISTFADFDVEFHSRSHLPEVKRRGLGRKPKVSEFYDDSQEAR